jgi:DEAD/DEAH box helicase domain-containing protein
MEIQAFLNHIRSKTGYEDQIAHIEHIAPRRPVYGKLDEPLSPALQDALDAHGFSRLYAHQAQAVNHVRAGKNVMVSTFSASGKTLVYQIAVMQSIINDPSTRAIFLFPTKALAQDQLHKLHELFSPTLLAQESIATFDGDTPRSERADVRRYGRIILTNPDMLHVGIMPQHQSWATLFKHLKYVVVDEAHIYRGVFGSHVACVLRRLRRLCQLYGSNPQFILCSATVANPGEHAQALTPARWSIKTAHRAAGRTSFSGTRPSSTRKRPPAARHTGNPPTFLPSSSYRVPAHLHLPARAA